MDRKIRFAYDGNQIVLQFEKDVSPLPPGEGQGEGGYDLTSPGEVHWTLTDNLNTVRDIAVYDAATLTTSVVAHIGYDGFGNVTGSIDPATGLPASVVCCFGFTGKLFDQATGLQNNLNRWYDAKTGVWASEDPISFTAGDPNTSR